MTEDEALETIEAYGELVADALTICKRLRLRVEPHYDSAASIVITEGDEAVIGWMDYQSYDEVTWQTSSFPAAFLWIEGDERERAILDWEEAQKREREAEARASRARHAAEAEARERAAYQALKAKYG